MPTIGNIIRAEGAAVVGVYARNYAEQVTPPAAIVQVFGHANVRLNGELTLRGEAVVETMASGAAPRIDVGAQGEAVVATYARANARLNGEIRVQPQAAIVELYGTATVAETWQFFQPLGSTGSEGGYAQSGTSLQPLDTQGEGGQLDEDIYAEGTASLPVLHSAGIGLTGGLGQHDVDFQPLLSIGSEGSYAEVTGSLAPLQSLGHQAAEDYGIASVEQPASTLNARGIQFFASASLEQPESTLTGRFGATGSFMQPAGELTLDGNFPIVGRARLTQPVSTFEAEGTSGSIGGTRLTQPRSTLQGQAGWRIDLVSPGHALAVDATLGAVGRAELSQPRTVLTASGERANTGQAYLEQPVGGLVPTGIILLEQPAAQLAASGGEQVEQYVYAAYAVNLAHSGVTEFTDYPFRRIVQFNGEYYGVGPQGVFRLEGSMDAGEVIRSVIETGRPDFGSSLYKRVTYTYLLMDTADVLHVSPITGEGDTHRRQALGSTQKGTHTRRVQFGKGLKARNWGVKIEHEGSDRFTLQDIEIVGEVLSRKVGG